MNITRAEALAARKFSRFSDTVQVHEAGRRDRHNTRGGPDGSPIELKGHFFPQVSETQRRTHGLDPAANAMFKCHYLERDKLGSDFRHEDFRIVRNGESYILTAEPRPYGRDQAWIFQLTAEAV